MKVQKRTDTAYGNALVGQREVRRAQELHRRALAATTSSIDTRAPPQQPHLTLYGRDYVTKKKATTEAAFSDLKMIQAIARTMTRSQSLPERQGPVSLNAESRKNEIFRIMHDNHKLLDQIENVQSFASTKDLLRQHRETKKYTIIASHAARVAGEYDQDIAVFKEETKKRAEAQAESVHRRLEKGRQQRKLKGTLSLPAIGNGSVSSGSGGIGAAPSKPAAKPSPKPAAKPAVRFAKGSSEQQKERPRPSDTPHPMKRGMSQALLEEGATKADEEGRDKAADALEKALLGGVPEEEEAAEAPALQSGATASEESRDRAAEALEAALSGAGAEAEAPAVPAAAEDDQEYEGFEKDESPPAEKPAAAAPEEDEYADDFVEESLEAADVEKARLESEEKEKEEAPAQAESFESATGGAADAEAANPPS